MRTLNDSLLELVRTKKVEPLEAYMRSTDKAELVGSLKRDGVEVELKGIE